MLQSKSTLFISLLFAAQLASAGSVIIEKSEQPRRVGGVILERGIIVQEKLASASIIEGEHVPKRGIIVQNQLAGVVILENTPRPDDIIVHDSKLAGVVIIERDGVILEEFSA